MLPNGQSGDNNLDVCLSECFKNLKASEGLSPLEHRPTQDAECPLLVKKATAENVQLGIEHDVTKPFRDLV